MDKELFDFVIAGHDLCGMEFGAMVGSRNCGKELILLEFLEVLDFSPPHLFEDEWTK